MKKLNVKLIKAGKEYRAVVAVCNGTSVAEFLSLLRASLPIPDAEVIGFKDCEGVLLIPSLICSDTSLILPDDYELLFRDRPASRKDDHFSHLISEIRSKNNLGEEEYFALRSWMRENHQIICQIYQTFIVKHDLDGFMEWLLKNCGIRSNVSEVIERPIPREHSRREEERPSTSRVGDRPRTSNQERKPNQKYLQLMSEMEGQGILEQLDVKTIKTLLLRDNYDVMREFDHYFLHNISVPELGNRLQKLADRLNLYMERPSSPLPKNKQLQFLVDSFVRENLIAAEDIEVLRKLIAEENEFVFSSFDVYESDRDQSELVDSLMRAINKYKKKNDESIKSSSFYPNPPPIESALQVLNAENMNKIIGKLKLCQNCSLEIIGMLKALVESMSNAVFSAFDNFLRHQDQGYLESHLYTIANSYFHLLLSSVFTLEYIQIIKKCIREGEENVTVIIQKFGTDGKIEEFLRALGEYLEVEVTNTQNHWENILQVVEDLGYDECQEVE